MRRGDVAIITGGASGIGRAFGEALATRGVEVVLADRDIELAEEAAERIRARGGAAVAAALDVRDFASFEALAKATRARTGRIDYLFNNAGVGVSGEMADYRPEDWDYVIDVNLRGVAWGVQAVYPIMREQRSGHIINTASVAGLLPATLGSYTATKHAVVGLSKSLRLEARAYGVRCSALCPGAIATPILKGGKYGRKRGLQPPDALRDKLWEKMRPMDPADFAEEALAGVRANDPYIIVPKWWRGAWLFERLAPRLSLMFWQRFADKTREQLEREGTRVEEQESEGASGGEQLASPS